MFLFKKRLRALCFFTQLHETFGKNYSIRFLLLLHFFNMTVFKWWQNAVRHKGQRLQQPCLVSFIFGLHGHDQCHAILFLVIFMTRPKFYKLFGMMIKSLCISHASVLPWKYVNFYGKKEKASSRDRVFNGTVIM